MSTYVLFGKYTPESVRGVNAKRTEEADKLIRVWAAKSGPVTRCSAISTCCSSSSCPTTTPR